MLSFVGKDSSKTSHIERFNLTLRQRVSRLGRKTLSFFKKYEKLYRGNLEFIHHYNENIAPNLATTP
ncbi:IS1 family transposase [Candidatus Electronema sp. TJ]|uniref:IS1 family transposase n=1 Tax=Candidatus Electronema sp. TJ TaxID=3401573 RepID=UPI003AA8BB6D